MNKVSVAAFLDELEKLALDPFTTSAALTAAKGLYSGVRHGPWRNGQSIPETQSAANVGSAERLMQGAEPGTLEHDQARQALQAAMTKHRANVSSAELAGAGLGIAGLQGVGIAGSNILSKNLQKTEDNLRTFRPLAEQLAANMQTKAPVEILPGAHIDQAMHMPKGGMLPKIFRKGEVASTAAAIEPWIMDRMESGASFANPPAEEARRMAEKWIDNGAVVIPTRAGPHIAAHELGHEAFGRSSVGRLVRAANVPSLVAGGLGTIYLSSKDPDSTAAKLAPVAGAAAVAPMLGEEAYASLRGLRALKEVGASPEVLRTGRRQLAKAFGTYGLKMGLPAIAGPELVRRYRKYRRDKRQKAGLDTSTALTEKIRQLKTGE